MPAAKFSPPSPPLVRAKHSGGQQTPRLIVLHSTVSACKPGAADAIARFFRIGANVTSAHYVVDPSKVIQMVPDHTVAYHCGFNQDSIGIEMCDIPDPKNKGRWDDVNHRAMERRTARLVAELCLAYGIPVRYVDAKALMRGDKGITTHANMSEAYKRSTHWDPGAWRRVRFMARVRRQVRRIKAGK